MIRALLICAALWTAPGALLVLAVCIVRARDNAKVRATRRKQQQEEARQKSSAEALELALMRREFDSIVAHFSTTDQENR